MRRPFKNYFEHLFLIALARCHLPGSLRVDDQQEVPEASPLQQAQGVCLSGTTKKWRVSRD